MFRYRNSNVYKVVVNEEEANVVASGDKGFHIFRNANPQKGDLVVFEPETGLFFRGLNSLVFRITHTESLGFSGAYGIVDKVLIAALHRDARLWFQPADGIEGDRILECDIVAARESGDRRKPGEESDSQA